ncbi:uncharacterized protein LOC108150824 [Drosophila miranda]|uniref:uncharacterized protein LOC108150824 n=1 Tax=Drosophila miranda TaxID=7229 RepID=UPI0007E6C687|nr:uncharacterized protein LOC108150824 [Drosophila miranda]XP_017134621.1 uncharacterized protein LOC108150824 [Drosophila miranda]
MSCPEHKKEKRSQQMLYTHGPGSSLKWQHNGSSFRNRAGSSPERSDELRRHGHRGRSRDRSRERERRRSDSPDPGEGPRVQGINWRCRPQQPSAAQKDDPQSQPGIGLGRGGSSVPFDQDRIHPETQERLKKLRSTLAKDPKMSATAKAGTSGSYFANDGSFLDIFKKMQEEQNTVARESIRAGGEVAPYIVTAAVDAPAPPPLCVGRRRGGRILKTGRVPKLQDRAKKKVDPKDFWSVYLAEVEKYNTTCCEKAEGHPNLVK